MNDEDLKLYAANMCKDMSVDALDGVVRGMYSSYQLMNILKDMDAIKYVMAHVMHNISELINERKANGTQGIIPNTTGQSPGQALSHG